MDFGGVLAKAWKIIWKFKVLWIFGFLSSCGRGVNSGGRGSSTSYRFSSGDRNLPPDLDRYFNDIVDFFDNIQGWEIVALILGFLLFILILVLITTAINAVGRIGLVTGTKKAEDGDERLTFRDLFSTGKSFFWRIFGFNLLIGLVAVVGLFIFIMPFVGITLFTAWIGILCLVPLLCLMVPILWFVNIMIEQMNIAMIVEDLKIKEGIIRGWEVFKANLGDVLVMGLMLGLINLVVGFLLAVPMILISIPIAIGVIGGTFSDSNILLGGGIATALLGLIILVPIVIVVNSILQSYLKTSWTLTYLQLTEVKDEEQDSGYETVILDREEI